MIKSGLGEATLQDEATGAVRSQDPPLRDLWARLPSNSRASARCLQLGAHIRSRRAADVAHTPRSVRTTAGSEAHVELEGLEWQETPRRSRGLTPLQTSPKQWSQASCPWHKGVQSMEPN